MTKEEKIAYYERVNSEFAELAYQEMAEERYGIDVCCDYKEKKDKWYVKKELLDLNGKNISLTDDEVKDNLIYRTFQATEQCNTVVFTIPVGGGTLTYYTCGSFIITTHIFADNTDPLLVNGELTVSCVRLDSWTLDTNMTVAVGDICN